MRTGLWIVRIVSILAIAIPMTAFAQEGPPPGEPGPSDFADRYARDLTERLSLTDEQAQKVREILTGIQKEMEDLRNAQENRVREILTEEQKQKFDEAVSTLGQRGQGRRFGRMVEPVLDRLSEKLSLSEEQAQQVRTILEGAQQQMMEEFRGMRERGAGDRDFESIRQRLEEFGNTVKEKIREVLTDEQKEAMDELEESGEGLFPDAQRFMQFFERGAGRRGAEGAEEAPERRLERALRSLEITDEEELEIIRPMLENLINTHADAQRQMGDARRELAETLANEDISEETVEVQLQIYRDRKNEQDVRVRELAEDLRVLLTLEQEARLVAQGILE